MILYVNGDGHTMAAEAVNPYKIAKDDPSLAHLGTLAHPENLAVSWGKILTVSLRTGFHCDATIDATVDTIINDTRNWLSQFTNPNTLVIIQWPLLTEIDHEKIWAFRQELFAKNIKHIFFNSVNDFSFIQNRYDWGKNYINPYDNYYTSIIKNSKIDTVNPKSEYFGKDGHNFWWRFLLNYIVANKFI